MRVDSEAYIDILGQVQTDLRLEEESLGIAFGLQVDDGASRRRRRVSSDTL